MLPLPTDESYGEVSRAIEHFNRSLFAGRLPPVLVTLTRKKHTMGYFAPQRFASHDHRRVDELSMNPGYFGIQSIQEVLSTLTHELSHVFQHHFGKPGRGRYHNRQWADLMENQLGLMPSDTGAPGGARTGDSMRHYIIPGGPFDRACAELLTENFRLSWYDRYPPSLPATFGDSAGSGTSTNFVEDDDLSGDGGDMDADVDVDVDNESARPEHAGRPQEALDLVAPGMVPGSNRCKFTCSGCDPRENAWGKPSLKILCMSCHTPMRPNYA